MSQTSNEKMTSGFTLMELSIVIVILGVLAAIAIPNYLMQRKRVCDQEGVVILRSVFDAQRDHFRDTGVFATDANNLTVTFDGESQCFNDYVLADGTTTESCGPSDINPVASIAAIDGSYTLHIGTFGDIVCCGAICAKLGYEN